MRRYNTFITEASFLKPDYVIGHKVMYNGKGFKDLDVLGYKKGDTFEIVGQTKNVAKMFGSEDGAAEKFLKAPDGKIYQFRGATSFKSSSFTHLKSAGSPPTGAEWEDVIVYAYNELNGKTTDSATMEVAMKFWDKYADQANVIASNFKKSLTAKQLVQTGRGIGNVSLGPIWTAEGAKNKTPKTDIASANFKERISLKKAGGCTCFPI